VAGAGILTSRFYTGPMPAAPQAFTTGAGLVAAALGLVLGSALQLMQPQLWPDTAYLALAACGATGLGAIAIALRIARRGAAQMGGPAWRLAWAGGVSAVAALAFAATGLRAGIALAEALPADLEGRDLRVVGVVAGLPQRTAEAWRFRLDVESAWLGTDAVAIPEHLAIGWYAERGAGIATLPPLRAGQRWQLSLRLKRPHGAQNPWGDDFELRLFEQGVRATGYVRTARGSDNRLLAERAGHPVARARQAVREAIERRVGSGDANVGRDEAGAPAALKNVGRDEAGVPAALANVGRDEAGVLAALANVGRDEAGVLAALVVGDQSAIDRGDWSLYRATGVAHLMSISGLHVTMFAWLAGLAAGWAWRRSRRAMLWRPAPQAARWGGLAAAFGYAVFAGWGVPAQRTVLMLAVVTLIGGLGLRWPALAVWLAAMAAVVLIDPWALLQAGFWLSFVAVGLLMLSEPGRGAAPAAAEPDGGMWARWRCTLHGGLRTQWVATLGLAPLSLVFFQQLSLVGFAANLVAIPLVTLAITPLAMLGVLLPPLWLPAAWLVALLNGGLRALADLSWAVWSVAAAPAWAVPAALLGAALALAPLPWRVRALALPLVLPLLAPVAPRPPPGSFELLAADVGQGTAVLVRTAQHTLLYDAGPQYSREADAGERVLLPLLRSLGEPRLDLLVLSHRDTDHVGGAAALLGGIAIARLSSSLDAAHPLRRLADAHAVDADTCRAGQRWQWDGVDFEFLHPDAARLERAAHDPPKPNTLSCVLRVSRVSHVSRAHEGAGPGSALLTGDLEREQELALVERQGSALRSDVLLVPHHGSKTSSSAAFLDAVSPRIAVVQAGYRNRFGHPAAEVAARYEARGIAFVTTARCGAWRADAQGMRCRRSESRRYWQHPDAVAGDNGVEVAISAPASEALEADTEN